MYAENAYPDFWFDDKEFLDSTGVGNSISSLDLGFGVGLDADHDWSDGSRFDLFDGFFFGSTGGTL